MGLVAPDHLKHVRTVAERLGRGFDKAPTHAAARKALEQALEAEREEALEAGARLIVGRAQGAADKREHEAQRKREDEDEAKRRRRDARKAHKALYGRKLAAELAEAVDPWSRLYVANIGSQRCAFSSREALEAAEEVARESALQTNRFGPPVAAERLGTVTGSLDLVDPSPGDLYALLNAEADARREADAKRRADRAERAERDRERQHYGVSLANVAED